jgi:hypothetical protein
MARQINLLVLAQQSMQEVAASGAPSRQQRQQQELLRGLQQQCQQALEDKVGGWALLELPAHRPTLWLQDPPCC